jgi:hypothetical protein
MEKLKTLYDKAEEIPVGFEELYAERNGKMELVNILGVKTEADVNRVNEALKKERVDHRASKGELAKFDGIDPELVHAQLEELETTKAQLEAFTKDGKIDETKLEPIINSRVKAALGPSEREKLVLVRSLDEQKKLTDIANKERDDLKSTVKHSSVERAIRDAAVQLKMVPTAIDDAVLTGMSMLDIADDGAIVTKDLKGLTPGIGPVDWLKDMQDKRPHWWPQSVGGGAGGGRGGNTARADNPWTKEGWNLTKQGAVVMAQGLAKATAMAESVGSKVGATAPTAAK